MTTINHEIENQFARYFIRQIPELAPHLKVGTEILKQPVRGELLSEQQIGEFFPHFDEVTYIVSQLTLNVDFMAQLVQRFGREVVDEVISDSTQLLDIIFTAFELADQELPLDDDAVQIGGGVVPET